MTCGCSFICKIEAVDLERNKNKKQSKVDMENCNLQWIYIKCIRWIRCDACIEYKWHSVHFTMMRQCSILSQRQWHCCRWLWCLSCRRWQLIWRSNYFIVIVGWFWINWCAHIAICRTSDIDVMQTTFQFFDRLVDGWNRWRRPMCNWTTFIAHGNSIYFACQFETIGCSLQFWA